MVRENKLRGLVFALTLLGASAFAAVPAAEALFTEGRTAMKANDFARACDAFGRSHALEPALGTLLNLATCLEKQGRLASAWIRLNEAVSWAQRTHEAEREQFARQHANELKPRLSWLALTSKEDVELSVDGQKLRLSASTPVSIPLDPGPHEVTASGPGLEQWTTVVTLSNQTGAVSQEVPVLKRSPVLGDLPPPPPPPVPIAGAPPTLLEQPSSGKLGPALLGIGGLVAVAGGVGLGWSLTTYDALQGQRAGLPMPQVRVSRPTFEQLRWALPLSWVGVGVGAAALATGAVFVLKGTAVTAAPIASPGGGGLSLSGSF